MSFGHIRKIARRRVDTESYKHTNQLSFVCIQNSGSKIVL